MNFSAYKFKLNKKNPVKETKKRKRKTEKTNKQEIIYHT